MEGMVNKMSKSTTKQKKSSAGKNVAIFFIVFVILEGLIIFGLSQAFKNEDSVVKIAGYSFFLMDSDNMGADAPKDSLVIASNGTPAKDKKGFAMLCKNVENEGTTVAWLYDISSKGDTVDGVVYTVFQEAYPDKMYDLKSEDIVGIATSYYKTAGKIVTFVTTPFGMGVCIAVPIFLLIVIELIIAAARRSHEDDYDDEDEDYDDDYDQNDNVTLDDFLYGGDNDDVYTTGKPKETYEEEFEDKYAAMLDRKPVPEPVSQPEMASPREIPEDDDENFGVYAFNVQPEPEAEPEPAPEPAVEEAPKNEVDPSYYEKASKMIDEAVANTAEPSVSEPAAEEKPAAAPAPQRKPRPQQRPSGQGAPRAKRPPQQGGRRPAGAANPQRRPRPQQSRPAAPRQDANAALQQLMQMMEEEQSKLKKSDKE